MSETDREREASGVSPAANSSPTPDSAEDAAADGVPSATNGQAEASPPVTTQSVSASEAGQDGDRAELEEAREKPLPSGVGANPADLSEKDKLLLEMWAKAVDTQMHFNEMSVKSRQLGLTFVTAALGVAVVLIGRGEDWSLPVGGCHLHVSVLILLVAALGLYLVSRLDMGVYHRMLRGAVAFGMDLEEHYIKPRFLGGPARLQMGMTQAITHFSRHEDANVDNGLPRESKGDGAKPYVYQGNSRSLAASRIARFYYGTIAALIVAAGLMFLVTK